MPIADACEIAAAVTGRAYGGKVTSDYLPTGCAWLSAGGSFYFNTAATGAAHEAAPPVCVGAPDV